MNSFRKFLEEEEIYSIIEKQSSNLEIQLEQQSIRRIITKVNEDPSQICELTYYSISKSKQNIELISKAIRIIYEPIIQYLEHRIAQVP